MLTLSLAREVNIKLYTKCSKMSTLFVYYNIYIYHYTIYNIFTLLSFADVLKQEKKYYKIFIINS